MNPIYGFSVDDLFLRASEFKHRLQSRRTLQFLHILLRHEPYLDSDIRPLTVIAASSHPRATYAMEISHGNQEAGLPEQWSLWQGIIFLKLHERWNQLSSTTSSSESLFPLLITSETNHDGKYITSNST